ncbi:Uncharacterized protein BP5553_08390 [Venustampulla echinocandica]|uniref:Uncharacterized protein n=1 Tax=Venustampulla echinocandica TaxID=2656787 RepID=A0A370TE56_9HELO|nr:Uncharacterized protein BP5553_08390 [Venustampulla echinocandica]RDL32951.1 Uncharacterized protein BP5553_08390 [Venustampulla echinocandica]
MVARDSIQHTAWTLRFKHGKHTILLCAEPLTPLSQIKTDLLEALREVYPNGLPRSDSPAPEKIPESIQDVALGALVDAYDPSRGWTELDNTPGGGNKESPKSLGLKDGGMVAFTFVNSDDVETPEFHVEFCNVEELYPEEE